MYHDVHDHLLGMGFNKDEVPFSHRDVPLVKDDVVVTEPAPQHYRS